MTHRPTSRRGRGWGAPPRLWLAALLLIIGLSACAPLPGLGGFFNTPAPAWTPGARPPGQATEPGTPGWYRLYFTDPDRTAQLDRPTGGIPQALAASIDTAQKSIDLAVYEFNWLPLAQALRRADQRGVTVRVVIDTDSLGEDAVSELIEAGIPVVGDGRNAFMHNKFMVVDGATVWTGSMNYTRSDAYRNNNNVIAIVSPRLAENYTREFEEMFLLGEFGPEAWQATPNPRVTIDGTRIENYFSPDDGVAERLAALLASADQSVYFMAFAFTRADLAQALIDRAAAGVTVQGVFERRQLAAGAIQAWERLTAAGLDVREDGNPYNLHSKVFILDERVVVLGSYNFSRNAEESNDENVLIIHNGEIARAYLAEWQKVWQQAAPPAQAAP